MMMNKPMVNAITALSLLGAVPTATRAETNPTPHLLPTTEKRCTVSGWIGFPSGSDVRLHEAANKTSRILSNFPNPAGQQSADDQDQPLSPTVDIHEATPQWLHVTVTTEGSETTTGAGTTIKGWLPSDAVRFGIQSGRGFEAASAQSKQIVTLNDDWASELGVIERIWDCQNDWVLIDYRQTLRRDGYALNDIPPQAQKTVKAWFRGICANPWTSCDMAPVDRD